jgi:hypothetical protein
MTDKDESNIENFLAPEAAFSDALRGLLCRANATEANIKYEIGTGLVSLKQRDGTYNKESIERIAANAFCTTDYIYEGALVVSAWPKALFQEMLDIRPEHGLSATFGHFVEAARIKDPEKRTKLLKAALRNGLSLRAFAAQVRGGHSR